MIEIKKPTILITDDDRIQRTILKTVIENKFDVNLLEAENGQIAIDILQENCETIDLVTLDWEMPTLNGIDAVAIISKKHPHIKTLMITGSVTDEKKDLALDAGADDFIKKPIQPNQLISILAKMLNISPKNNE